MFIEKHQVSRQAIEKLLHKIYVPDHDEIVESNHIMQRDRDTMKIEKSTDYVTASFADLDLSFLQDINSPVAYTPPVNHDMFVTMCTLNSNRFSLNNDPSFAA